MIIQGQGQVDRQTQTKEAIFNAAMRLFSEKGYSATTVRQIAGLSGVGLSSVYWYYTNKEAMLNEILTTFQHKIESYLVTSEQADRYIETDTPRQLLERYCPHFQQEEAGFMMMAFRIVYMEQFTNSIARDIIVGQFHHKTVESIRYVLDLLIQRGKIPAYDTAYLAELWAQTKFYDAVILMHRIADGQAAEEAVWEYMFNDRMVDVALTGKVPKTQE